MLTSIDQLAWSVKMTQFTQIYNKLDQNERKQYDCNETRSLGFDFPRDSTTLHATTKMANWQNFAEFFPEKDNFVS